MSHLPAIQAEAPAFTQLALFPDKEFRNLSLSDYRGKWVVFFWYPLDFTFVCPTEIIAFSDRSSEFDAINTQVIAASCDSEFSHLAWVNTPRSAGGLGHMKIPILADFSKAVANQYGVLLPGGVPLRALFIISPTGILRQITVNDLPVGRNVDEILRLVKAFQFTDEHGEVCPANWHPGDITMQADPQKSQAYFSSVHGEDAAASSEEALVHEITSATAFAELIGHDSQSPAKRAKHTRLVVVQYWAPWCRNCHKLNPELAKLAKENPSIGFNKVNTVDLEEVAISQNISALPSFQIFKDGVLVHTYTGSDIAALKASIHKYA